MRCLLNFDAIEILAIWFLSYRGVAANENRLLLIGCADKMYIHF